MAEERAFQRAKCNISMLVPDCHRRLYQLGKNLASWKLIELLPLISCEPHLALYNFHQEVSGN